MPRQNQSGTTDRRGHITKHGSSLLRFILVTAAHSAIKYSKRMKAKYSSIVRRLGENRSIVAIARLLLETIYIMLTRNEGFVDQIDSLTERKIRAMHERSVHPHKAQNVEESLKQIKLIRSKRIGGTSKELFS